MSQHGGERDGRRGNRGKGRFLCACAWGRADPPERVSCLHELSHARLHAADAHEGGRDACEQGEEENDEGGVPEVHAEAQGRQQAGGNTGLVFQYWLHGDVVVDGCWCSRQQVQQTGEEDGEEVAVLGHGAVLHRHGLDAVVFDAGLQEPLVPSRVLLIVH